MTSVTVIQYVLSRLKNIGITDVFGVPGDYSFAVCDAICEDPEMQWIGCCNELNAAYAADGYARIKGAGALCTTYGVGELSAINGIAGAYAEHLPVFHLVGTPGIKTQAARALMHHTLGNGEFNLFQQMSEPVVCAMAVMTPQNVAFETERLIAEAFYHRRPVYMAFPADYANEPVLRSAEAIPVSGSNPATLEKVANAIIEALAEAGTACMIPGILVARTGLQSVTKTLVDNSGLPFATMFMAKSVLDEQHPNFIGMYDGKLMNENVRNFVENCDLILEVGAMHTDFNTGAFTANIDIAKTISISHHSTKVRGKVYTNVEIGDVVRILAQQLQSRKLWAKPKLPPRNLPALDTVSPITAELLYPVLSNFLLPDDILIAETGTCSMGLGFELMPAGATFHNQTLWGSIGWATPAAFGAAIAAPGKRIVLVTGEGAHQFTAQEISQFGRLGLKPVIFVLNNSGYLIERLLCKDPEIVYNDIASWNYGELPNALGCFDWFTACVTTFGELNEAMQTATDGNKASYIEIVTDAYESSALAMKLHESITTLYNG
jgi:indolepyruvate decarboxylase